MTSNAQTTEGTPKSTSSAAPTSRESEQTDSSITLDLSGGALLVQKIKGRENKRMKAIRLLVTGRLRVLRVDADFISAECRGDSGGVYHLGFDPIRKQWRCTCEARTACSHLTALWSVTAVER